MKKLIYVLLALVLISVNVFGYSLMGNQQLLKILYTSNQLVHIDYNKSNLKNMDLVDRLVKFSKEKSINISQYNFLSEKDLKIYSTNIKNDPNIHLESGEIPKGITYISNENLDSEDTKQSGVFSFPLSNWRVQIYDIQQVKNVGLGNEFYLSGANSDTLDAFVKEFSNYGDISLANENISSLALINMPLLMVVIFSFVVFFLGMFYFIIHNRKMLLLQELWGYSKWLMLTSVPRMLLRFLIIIISLLLLGVILFTILLGKTYFLTDYLIIFILINGVTVLVLFFITLAEIAFIQKFNNSSVNIRGKLPFEKVMLISSILKAVTSIILFSVISSLVVNFYYLSKAVDSLDYWNQTQNVFRIQVGPLDEDIDDNLEKDRDLNNRLFAFYKDIESKNEAFLMESQNFHIIDYNSGRPIYSYTQNTSQKDEIYSPKGRKVTINENYLNINPIDSSNGIAIEKQIKSDKDTLNILVPEQFRNFENKIIESYREWFYFQKVYVDNIYNQEIGYPLNKKKIDDLKVNIIYTRSGQEYFTYNSDTGNSQNRITDPIAVIYNGSVDTSNIGAYATTSLFFVDNSQGSAFENILPSITKANVPEINNALSVYDEANDEIIQQQWLLFQQMIGLVITIIFSGILFFALIWSYYNANFYQISIKYLFGYSYWKRNRSIILITIISNVISGLIVYLVYDVSIIILIIGLVLIIDLAVIDILSNYLNNKNIRKVLKGDHV